MHDPRTAKELLADVRRRVDKRTFIQDLSEPFTGNVDRRKIAAKFNNLEHAVDELASVVETVIDDAEAKSA